MSDHLVAADSLRHEETRPNQFEDGLAPSIGSTAHFFQKRLCQEKSHEIAAIQLFIVKLACYILQRRVGYRISEGFSDHR